MWQSRPQWQIFGATILLMSSYAGCQPQSSGTALRMDRQIVKSDSNAFLSTRLVVPGTHNTEADRLWFSFNPDDQPVAQAFARYQQRLNKSSVLVSRTFSGAVCVSYRFNSTCKAATPPIAYIADADEFMPYYFSTTGQKQYGGMGVAGQLQSSICSSNVSQCSNGSYAKTVSLDPMRTYMLVMGNNGMQDCPVISLYTTFDVGSAECAGLPVPELPAGQPAEPLFLTSPVRGTTHTDYVERSKGQPKAEYRVSMAFTNLSCIYASLDIFGEQPANAHLYSLSLIALPDFAAAVIAGNASQPELLSDIPEGSTERSALAEGVLAGCTAEQCNAKAQVWLQLVGLDPNATYLLLTAPADPAVIPGNGRNGSMRVAALMQPFSADQCERLPSMPVLKRSGPQVATWPLTEGRYSEPVLSSSLVDFSQAHYTDMWTYSPPPSPTTSSPPVASDDSDRHKLVAVASVLSVLLALALAAALYLGLAVRQQKQKFRQHIFGPSTLTEKSFNEQHMELAPLSNGKEASDSVSTIAEDDATGAAVPATDIAAPLPQRPSGAGSTFSDKPASKHSTNTFSSLAASIEQTLDDWEIDPKSIKVVSQLGEGAHGKVFKAMEGGSREVAIKVCADAMQEMTAQRFWQEVKLIADLRDRHIIQFYGAAISEDGAILVTELMEGGDLFNALHSGAVEHIDSELCWNRKGSRIALDVAKGLFYLHSRKVAHLDLKSPNILLTRECNSAKIGDVGMARTIATKNLHSVSSAVGTWAWAAPEALKGQHVSMASDCWSFGVVMYELICGEKPQRGRMRQPRPEEAPAAAVEVMYDCMSEVGEMRPTAKQIIERLLALQTS